MTPTQRSIAYFRKQGLICGIVERWIPNPKHSGGGFRKDFLGIIDLIFLGADGVVGVQSCGQDFSAHRRKLIEEKHEEARAWLETPGTSLLLIGWRKVAATRGSAQRVWKPRLEKIILSNGGEVISESV